MDSTGPEKVVSPTGSDGGVKLTGSLSSPFATPAEVPQTTSEQNDGVKKPTSPAAPEVASPKAAESKDLQNGTMKEKAASPVVQEKETASSTARENPSASQNGGLKERVFGTSPASKAPEVNDGSLKERILGKSPASRAPEVASSIPNPLRQINLGGLGTPAPRFNLPADTFDPSSARYKFEQQLTPTGKKSLAGIALRSHLLGIALASSIWFIYQTASTTPLWRIPFFIATLSAFHFLEFYTLAYANTPEAQISTFLFTSNGAPYAIAHITAILECLITNTFFPNFRILPYQFMTAICVFVGIVVVVVGQGIRSWAILSAKRSFTHIVQTTKRPEHTLVTDGVYKFLRHPSYFGFFWWGLGTQIVLGNTISFIGYAVVLHKFFSSRIKGEERELIEFFGDEYVQFRDKTPVGIPFIK